MNPWLLIIPVISAALGFIINSITTQYFFATYLPAKKNEIISGISNKMNDILPLADIQSKIADPNLIEKAMPMIEQHIDEFLNVKLPQEIPMLGMFIGNKTTDKIKEVFMNQVKLLFPQVMVKIVGDVKENFNIQQMLTHRLQNMNVEQELQIKMKKPLNKYKIAGAVGGFIIGCINLLLFYWLA